MKRSTAKPAKLKKTTSKTTSASRSSSRTAPAAEKPGKKPPASASQGPRVMADHQRRTCLEVERSGEAVQFIALDIEHGLDVAISDSQSFDQRFNPMVDYPVEKAAQLYLEYARKLGASERAMNELGKLTKVTKEDTDMATKKKAARAEKVVKTSKKSPASKSAEAEPVKAKTKKAAAKKPAAEKQARAPRGPTAAAKFQELIMAGKLTDDKIFATVQKEFGLDDSKRSYVKWYRNYLTKQGKNPPDAVE